MPYLTYIEKETIRRLFGISGGFVFKYWSDQGNYNKTKTKELIYDACGINIFQDDGYRGLSQEKCINKIWDEGSPQTIAKLLETLSEYFCFAMGASWWEDEDQHDYNQVQEIIKRLRKMPSVELPAKQIPQTLSVILEDIENNFREQKPELIIDRLHTFTCEYLRNLCAQHGISTVDDKGKEQPIHSLVGMLSKWYKDNNYCESQFALTAIKNSISLFENFNHARNDHSAAHPNHLLSKSEAEYVVRIVADTLTFLDRIEQRQEVNAPLQEDEPLLFEADDELPF